MNYRCLIVDDEPLARELLTQFIRQLPSLTLMDCCADAFAALQVLHGQPIDLLFIDIKMPQLSGLDLIKTLTSPPKIILTTAFSDYALEGFDVGVVDYLVKPFSFVRFLRAVDRAIDRGRLAEPAPAVGTSPSTCLFLKTDRKIVKVLLANVLYWQAYGNYAKVIQRDGRPLLVTETMTHLEKLLPGDQFVRIHKSYIVSLSGITEYQSSILSVGPVSLPIGESYRKQFLAAIGQVPPTRSIHTS